MIHANNDAQSKRNVPHPMEPMMNNSSARRRNRFAGFTWAHLIAFFALDVLMAVALVIMLTSALSNDIEIPPTEPVDDASLALALESASPPVPSSPLDDFDVSSVVLNVLATTRQLLEPPPTEAPDDGFPPATKPPPPKNTAIVFPTATPKPAPTAAPRPVLPQPPSTA